MSLKSSGAALNRLMQDRNPDRKELSRLLMMASGEARKLARRERLFIEARREIRIGSLSRYRSIKRFARFLATEKKVLIKAGVRPQNASAVLREAKRLSRDAAPVDVERLPRALQSFSVSLRASAADLETQLEKDLFIRKAKRLLKKAVWTVGGGIVTGSNLLWVNDADHKSASVQLGMTLIAAGIAK